jgi:hypothetical protein
LALGLLVALGGPLAGLAPGAEGAAEEPKPATGPKSTPDAAAGSGTDSSTDFAASTNQGGGVTGGLLGSGQGQQHAGNDGEGSDNVAADTEKAEIWIRVIDRRTGEDVDHATVTVTKTEGSGELHLRHAVPWWRAALAGSHSYDIVVTASGYQQRKVTGTPHLTKDRWNVQVFLQPNAQPSGTPRTNAQGSPSGRSEAASEPGRPPADEHEPTVGEADEHEPSVGETGGDVAAKPKPTATVSPTPAPTVLTVDLTGPWPTLATIALFLSAVLLFVGLIFQALGFFQLRSAMGLADRVPLEWAREAAEALEKSVADGIRRAEEQRVRGLRDAGATAQNREPRGGADEVPVDAPGGGILDLERRQGAWEEAQRWQGADTEGWLTPAAETRSWREQGGDSRRDLVTDYEQVRQAGDQSAIEGFQRRYSTTRLSLVNRDELAANPNALPRFEAHGRGYFLAVEHEGRWSCFPWFSFELGDETYKPVFQQRGYGSNRLASAATLQRLGEAWTLVSPGRLDGGR